MKDRLRSIVELAPPHQRPGIMREFLQCMALRALHEGHDFGKIAFIGGTALRLLFDLPRFSEDLDFSLLEKGEFDFTKMIEEIRNSFFTASIEVNISETKAKTAVRGFWIKFPRLFHEMGVSSDPRRVLSIKFEVDCNPPDGAVIERRLINRHFPVAVVYYNLQSLFAGKLHAVLTRAYVKGRDFYDLVWYRTRHPSLEPNITLLNAALIQSRWSGEKISLENWRSTVADRIESVKWNEVVRDISPFLEDENDLKMMKLEYIRPLFK